MKFVLKILAAPVSLVITVFIKLCALLLSCSSIVFGIAGTIAAVFAVIVLLTQSVKNGIILLVTAFLVSPMGLPMLAVKLLGGLQSVNDKLVRLIRG